ncbi:MAG: serine hydrolase [Saprospiraceae bacterium]|nr:serine hydrolase [Saprospiraceae bacterium]
MGRFKLLLLTLTVFIFNQCASNKMKQSGALLQVEDTTLAAKMDAVINDLYKEHNIQSGLAIGVVKDGKIIYSRGFGSRYPDKKLPMTTETPFYIASSTKLFVAFAAKKLETQGKLSLQKSMAENLPGFSFSNPKLDASTIKMTELISHTHGINNIPAQVWTAFLGARSDQQIDSLLQSQSFPFPDKQYRYSNLGMIFTAYIIRQVTGKSWQQQVEDLIFKPLDMKNSACYVSKFSQDEIARNVIDAEKNAATSNFLKKDNTMSPAGGMMASVNDLLHWVSVFTNDGKYGDQQILSNTELEDILTPYAKQDRPWNDYQRTGYSLGWDVAMFNGEKMYSRFGGFDGLSTHISFLPEHKIGIVAVSNGDVFPYIPHLSANYVYNIMLNKENAETMLLENREALKSKVARDKEAREKARPGKPTYQENVINYMGVYHDATWGTIKINMENEILTFKWENLNGKAYPQADRPHVYRVEMDIVDLSGNIEFLFENDKLAGLRNGQMKFVKVK